MREREEERKRDKGQTNQPTRHQCILQIHFFLISILFSCDYFTHYIFIVCSLHKFVLWVCFKCVLFATPFFLFIISTWISLIEFLLSVSFASPKMNYKNEMNVQCILMALCSHIHLLKQLRASCIFVSFIRTKWVHWLLCGCCCIVFLLLLFTFAGWFD